MTKRIIYTVAIAVSVAAIATAVFFNVPKSAEITSDENNEIRKIITVPEGKKRYSNPAFGFALTLPKEIDISTYHEPRQATRTVTFNMPNPETGQFQIYLVPYAKDKVTSSQVMKDTHGRAVGEPEDVLINEELQALTFLTEDPILGTLREVWFINNGYLYEVTAPVTLDVWLLEIMRTWEFL